MSHKKESKAPITPFKEALLESLTAENAPKARAASY